MPSHPAHYTRRSRSPALVNCPLVASETRHHETKRNIFPQCWKNNSDHPQGHGSLVVEITTFETVAEIAMVPSNVVV
jgi:hypothetical protein